MYSGEQIIALLEKVAKRTTSINTDNNPEVQDSPLSIIDVEKWEWAQGVGMYGLLKYYQATGSREYLNYLIGWYDRRMEEGMPSKNVNSVAPILTMAHLYEITENRKYIELCKEWAEWVMNEMPRTEENGMQHVTQYVKNEQQLWDDTLFMTVLFLAKMGAVLNRRDYTQEAIRQFLVHIKFLQDRKTGLWFHGWTFIERSNYAEALWGRGNCWFTAGVVDFLEMAEMEEGVKMYLTDALTAQVKKLAEVQREDGMWHTLLDDPGSYGESSATAGFGYGILKAVRKGYIDKKYYETGKKALNAIVKRIDSDGTVQEVSFGTCIGDTLDYYREIPLCPMTYGQALTIMLLSEALKHSL